MAAYMPQRQYDLQQARETFAEVRKMPRKQQETAIPSMKKQYVLNINPPSVEFGVPCQQAGDALELVAAVLDLYCEIKRIARANLNIRASIYYRQPASQSDKRQWNIVKGKFAAAPYLMKMTALCLTGSEASDLDDRLEPYRKRSLAGGVGYIQEPYWSDRVNILEHADMCPVRNFSGIIKNGEPPRYCWKARPELEIKGTINPNQKGTVGTNRALQKSGMSNCVADKPQKVLKVQASSLLFGHMPESSLEAIAQAQVHTYYLGVCRAWPHQM